MPAPPRYFWFSTAMGTVVDLKDSGGGGGDTLVASSFGFGLVLGVLAVHAVGIEIYRSKVRVSFYCCCCFVAIGFALFLFCAVFGFCLV